MKRICILASLLLSATAAQAQIAEAYATANFTHVSNIEVVGVYAAGTTTGFFKSVSPVGVGGGVTLNFLPLPVIKLGIDFRGSTRPGLNGADTALGGIKLTVAPPLIKPKFFLEGAVGYLATRADATGTYTVGTSTSGAVGQANDQFAIYQIIGGVDYPLIHFVDFRIEAAGGSSFGNGGFIGIGNGDGSSAKIFSINTGFVVHF